MYSVTLSNGVKLTGLHVNGSAFETQEDVSREDLAGGLRRVVVKRESEDEGEGYMPEGEYENMKLGYYGRHGGVLQFVLCEADAREQELLRLRGDIDYVAMISGVEL